MQSLNGQLSGIGADSGRIQVRGCSFATGGTSISLRAGVKQVIISENNAGASVNIDNAIGECGTPEQ